MTDQVQEIKDHNDIVEIVGGYLTLKKAGVNYKANCPFHSEKSPSFMVNPERQSFKCFGCFPAGQLIQTADGLKEIQEIKKGDLLFTDKGRLRHIDIVFERDYSGDLLEITPRMIVTPIKITGDHNVFVIKTKNCKQKSRSNRICQKNCKQNCPDKYFLDYKIEKVKARKLQENDILLYPIKEFDREQTNKINLVDFSGAQFKRGLKPRDFPIELLVDKDFARLAGFYIAEGSSHRAYVRFSFGNDELNFANEVVKLIEKIFCLQSSIHHRANNKNGIEVTCCNSMLARIFENIFGKGAENKQIPSFFFTRENRIKSALVNAIFDGDGTTIKNSKKGNTGRKSIRTISLELAHQLKDLLLSLGERPSVGSRKGYVSPAGIHHKISYDISWRENNKTHFSDFIEEKGVRYWLLPIRKIVNQVFTGKVYNFNIEEDHSYLTQSFAVSNCGEGGDVITFVEKMEGLDFYNALKLLAEKAGVTLKSNSIQHGANTHSADKKTRLFEINEWAAKVYNKLLTDHPKAEAARKYLEKRGLSSETIRNFNIGYAPDSWDFILRFLISKKYTEAEAVEAGVAIKSERGKIYDRFRGRIMFPINNSMGTTVAFTARILEVAGKDETGAKYLNSSESAIYTKGKVIYGLDRAKMAIKDADLAIMVEGNMDVIACHQAGFANVVATSGTALTLDQLKILSRYASTIAFCFDTDIAGQTAMKRAVRIALANDISTKIITTAPFKDADEAITADPKNWIKMVEGAKPSLEYWINQLVAQKDKLDVDTKKKIAKEILPVIKIIASEIEKEHYLKYLADVLSVSEQSLVDALDKAKADADFSRRGQANELLQTEPKRLSRAEKILGFVWAEPELVKMISPGIIKFPDKYEPLSQQLKTGKIERDKLSPELAADLDGLAMSALKDLDSNDPEIVETELNYLVGRIKLDEREQIKADFAHRISQAEESGDKEAAKKLLREFSDLIK